MYGLNLHRVGGFFPNFIGFHLSRLVCSSVGSATNIGPAQRVRNRKSIQSICANLQHKRWLHGRKQRSRNFGPKQAFTADHCFNFAPGCLVVISISIPGLTK